MRYFFFALSISFTSTFLFSQHSIARKWNEVLLNAIRNDYARPTVHARNLFHSSILMYDSWAVYQSLQQTYFLDNSILGDYNVNFNGITPPSNIDSATSVTMSYAMEKLLKHRFQFAPKSSIIYNQIDSLMIALGYDLDFTSTDYSDNTNAALGN